MYMKINKLIYKRKNFMKNICKDCKKNKLKHKQNQQTPPIQPKWNIINKRKIYY